MKKIKKPWIMLKEYIDSEDYGLISKLQEECNSAMTTALKLELDYKLSTAESTADKNSNLKYINEFMYFDGEQLIGYIGICSYGGKGKPIEANGMVHPDYRQQGVFKKLHELAMADWKRRNSGNMLLLCDRKSTEGQRFIGGTGAIYKNSEYEMYLRDYETSPTQIQQCKISLRKASNADALEIERQNAIYFGDIFENSQDGSNDTDDIIAPEEEEKRGMTIYIAEIDQNIIGKVHIQLISGLGGIYGLGVLPEYRGKGYGKAILMMAVDKLKEANANDIMLQVEAENSNALNLYKSCGFVETSTMDYFQMTI